MTRTFARSLMRILVVHRYAQIYTDIHVVRYYSSTNTLPINAPLDRHPTPRVGGRMYNRRYLHMWMFINYVCRAFAHVVVIVVVASICLFLDFRVYCLPIRPSKVG